MTAHRPPKSANEPQPPPSTDPRSANASGARRPLVGDHVSALVRVVTESPDGLRALCAGALSSTIRERLDLSRVELRPTPTDPLLPLRWEGCATWQMPIRTDSTPETALVVLKAQSTPEDMFLLDFSGLQSRLWNEQERSQQRHTPIIPLVFNYGAKWCAPRSIPAMMAGPPELVMYSMGGIIPEAPTLHFNLGHLTLEEALSVPGQFAAMRVPSPPSLQEMLAGPPELQRASMASYTPLVPVAHYDLVGFTPEALATRPELPPAIRVACFVLQRSPIASALMDELSLIRDDLRTLAQTPEGRGLLPVLSKYVAEVATGDVQGVHKLLRDTLTSGRDST